MLKLKNHSFSRSQLLQGPRNPAAKLTPHQISLRVCTAAPIRNLRQHVELLSLRISYDRSVFFAHLLLANVVQAQIGHNPVNPGIERALEPEASDIFVCLQES